MTKYWMARPCDVTRIPYPACIKLFCSKPSEAWAPYPICALLNPTHIPMTLGHYPDKECNLM